MQAPSLYPYNLPNANFPKFLEVQDTSNSLKNFEKDANAIASTSTQNSLSVETLVTVCKLVAQIGNKEFAHISRKDKTLQPQLSHSVTIVPSEKGKTVFISLHKSYSGSRGGQGFTLRHAVKIEFDESSRLSKASLAVQSIMAISTPFAESSPQKNFKDQRIWAMQALKDSPYFPKNFAFVQTTGRKDPKLRIFQEQASCDLFVHYKAHNERLNSLPLEEKKLIYKNLLCALLDLQIQGIAHRDIKTENILLWTSPEGKITNVKLTDLGLAVKVCDYEALKTPVGNYGILAPEILNSMIFNQKMPPIGTPTDIWSLGLVLHLLHDSHPLLLQQHLDDEETNVNEVLYELKNLSPYPKKLTSLEELNNAMLQYDPATRISPENAIKALAPIQETNAAGCILW